MDVQEEFESNGSVHSSNGSNSKIPVDRGWAWFVLLGATINVMALMMFLRAASLLFILFLDIYQASATMTTLVFALSSVTFSTSNIIASTVLTRHFEVRNLCLTGAFINFFTIVGIAFAPNIIVVNVLFAVLGCAHGLIVVPQLTLVGRYFKKHLSLATATTTIGISISTISSTPVTQMLLDMYGVRGTVLLLAAITLHCIPASMLLRPISFYTAVPTEKAAVNGNGDAEKCCDVEKGDDISPNEDQDQDQLETEGCDTVSYLLKTDLKNKNNIKMNRNMPQRRQRSVSESWHVSTRTAVNVDQMYSNFKIYENEDANNAATNYKAIGTSVSNILSSSFRYLSDTNSLYGSSISQFRNSNKLKTLSELDMKIHREVRSASAEKVPLQENHRNDSESANKSFLHKLRDSASRSVYTNPMGLLLLVASGVGIHAQAGVNYMPATGVENGLNENQVSLLLTALGVADVISKFAVGVLADTGIISRINIACLTQLSIGVIFQSVAVFQGFTLMLVLQVLVGLCIGVFHVLLPVITVDLLGVQHMGHIVAGYMLINGIMNALDHIVVGSLSDLTGSFYGSYHYMGALALLSVAMLSARPLAQRCSKSKDTEGN
ncbi:hypothetical protein EGW08_009497 [Elysia chlorotica]|uniref:Major facilitator superfamily (MFS) profile domain-containing protein n=1 Tax=Elysia chlorotica TaxID=188477 RepID=A0A433TME7_ELYCH|nr:hypothetical protein EGW08_009497 [Elysia chlorotica]